MAIVTVHGIAMRQCDLFKVHLIIHSVWMVLADIILPAAGTTGRSCHAIADAVCLIHDTDVTETLMGNDVVAEDIQILLYHRTQILAEFLDVGNEVRINVSLQATYSIIVLYQPAAGCLFHHVQYVLTIAHSIKESRKRTQVLSAASRVKEMVVYTLQLIHDRTDIADAVGQFYAHALLNDTDKRMTVHHGRQVVHTVGQCQRLRISELFAEFLDATMDIAQMRIDPGDGLTVQHRLQTKYTVGRRVLRTDVHDEIVICKQRMLCTDKLTLLVEIPLRGRIKFDIILRSVHILCRIHVVILTQRISLEVVSQEETAHIRMTEELDAIEVVDLAFKQIGICPQIED